MIKEGDGVTATVDMSAYNEENPESAMEESSVDDLRIRLATLITDSRVVFVTQTTDEKVPAIEDSDTFTEE